MKITDDDNNALPWDGEAFGALKVRGPWICSSYYKLEGSEAHAEAGWFETGDVATISPQGYVAITDRTKDVIKSGVSGSRQSRWKTAPPATTRWQRPP